MSLSVDHRSSLLFCYFSTDALSRSLLSAPGRCPLRSASHFSPPLLLPALHPPLHSPSSCIAPPSHSSSPPLLHPLAMPRSAHPPLPFSSLFSHTLLSPSVVAQRSASLSLLLRLSPSDSVVFFISERRRPPLLPIAEATAAASVRAAAAAATVATVAAKLGSYSNRGCNPLSCSTSSSCHPSFQPTNVFKL